MFFHILKKFSTSELTVEFEKLQSDRKKMISEIYELDTKLIGFRLELDHRKEIERQKSESDRDIERSSRFDDD